jgi:cytidyltransferase-like protein
MTVVLVTGGFDPLHSGHIEYFKAAKALGFLLIVGLNSDAWLTRKKGQPFMPIQERMSIIKNLYQVHNVIEFDDSDDTAIDAIKKVKELYPKSNIIFANGGDRTKDNIPEMVFDDVKFVFGVGGTDKKNSSSWILQEWKNPKTERPWGWYRILDTQVGIKVKELVINPGQSLSMQRHFNRSEHWYVLKGNCKIETEVDNVRNVKSLQSNQTYIIEQQTWHRGFNDSDEKCHILEVQYGDLCIEEDIERM